MKRGLTILLVGTMVFASLKLKGQTPLGINYQGIARSADGSPLINQFIGLRISVTSGPDGSNDYVEEHHPETNAFGLFAVVIGQGQSAGRISEVDWGAGNKWLQIEIDPQDNGDYLLVGTQQMMSVPYALYAANSGQKLTPGFGVDISNGRINNVLPDQIINLNGTGAATVTGTYPNFNIDVSGNNDDADADPNNEIQALNKSGNTVTLSNGGGSFTDAVDDADANTTNELQTVSKAGNTVTLSHGGGSFADAVNDADANATNELQTVSKTGNTVTLSNGGGSFTDAVTDADANATNELQTVSKTGNTVTLSNSGGSFTDAVNDADANATNEIQSLSKTGNNLNLSSGGTVDLSSYLDNTDSQNLSFTSAGTNRTINISDGTGTTFSVADNDNSSSNELITSGNYIANNTLRITDAGGNTNIHLGTLNDNLDANSNRITNVADPTNPGDAINLGYFETKNATDYAMSIPLTHVSSSAGDVALNLSGYILDKGGLITGSTITISEAGVYAVSVQGISALSIGSDIEITINGTPTPIIKGVNHYMGVYLFDLVAGDQIQVVVKFGAVVETINLQVSAYKI